MADIPEEALQAAADAHERWYLDHGGDPDRCYFESHKKWSKATLEAAYAALAAQVRRDLLASAQAGECAQCGEVHSVREGEDGSSYIHPSDGHAYWKASEETLDWLARKIGEADDPR